jgi:hypothetical protein
MLNPDKTLAIILGVSDCPRAENLQPLPQCKNSADDFYAYLRTALRLPKSNIINLFDSPAHASEQMDKIEDWLAGNAGSRFSDLFVYYSGHGGFTRNDQAYFLAVQRTRSGSEGATSIRYVDLASSIRRHADSLRKYWIAVSRPPPCCGPRPTSASSFCHGWRTSFPRPAPPCCARRRPSSSRSHPPASAIRCFPARFCNASRTA